MALLHDDVLDAALQYLIDNVEAIHLTDGFDPDTNDRDWVIANSLGSAAVVGGDWTGPEDGAVDGRQATLGALNSSYAASLGAGAGDLVIVLISDADVLYSVDEVSEKELVLGESFDFPAVPIRFRDPA